jgi:hypothetical protein
MRLKDVVSFSSIAGIIMTLTLGCGQSEVAVAPAPAQQPLPTQPLPKEVKKGGGASSSGNMKRNPFDPLQK